MSTTCFLALKTNIERSNNCFASLIETSTNWDHFDFPRIKLINLAWGIVEEAQQVLESFRYDLARLKSVIL